MPAEPAHTPASGSAAGCVWVDGEFHGPDEASIAVTDRGFLYGDSVFESLLVRRGAVAGMAGHHERLVQSAAVLGIDGVPGAGELQALVTATAARSGLENAYVRVTVTRGRGGRGPDPAGAGAPTIVVAALAPPAPPPPGGVDLVLLDPAPLPTMPPVTVKCGNYLRAVLARAEASRRGAHDALYRDPDGNVTEASTSNVFVVTGRMLLTPPASVCLPGITRARVLALARGVGLEAEEGPVPAEALAGADEVFLTNAVAGAYPVRSADSRAIGTSVPGPRTAAIASALKEQP